MLPPLWFNDLTDMSNSYEQPADAHRAPELWTTSALWLKIRKLLSLQVSTVRSVQQNLKELHELSFDEGDHLEGADTQLSNLQDRLEQEVIKPTASITNLVSLDTIATCMSTHSLDVYLGRTSRLQTRASS